MPIAAVTGQNAGANAPASATVSVAFPSNVQAGSLITVIGWRYRGSNTAYTAGNCTKLSGTATIGTITLDRQHSIDFGGGFGFGQVGIWSAIVTAGGSLTMQIGGGDGGTYQSIAIHEFTGNWDATRVEATNSNATATDNTTPAHSGDATSAGAALFIGGLSLGSASLQTLTPDAAFTQIYENEAGATSQVGSAIYRIVSTGTTDRAEWTVPTTANEGWLAAVAVYREVTPKSLVFNPTARMLPLLVR